jgi:hypothetical protein
VRQKQFEALQVSHSLGNTDVTSVALFAKKGRLLHSIDETPM